MDNTPQLTLWQRIMADTPTFWKKVHLIGLGLATIVAAVTTAVTQIYSPLPHLVTVSLAVAAGIAAVLAALPLAAVKDTAILSKPDATIQDYANVLSDMRNQYVQVQAIIDNTAQAINAGKVTPAQPVADTPVTQEPIVTGLKPEVPAPEPVQAIAAVPQVQIPAQQAAGTTIEFPQTTPQS